MCQKNSHQLNSMVAAFAGFGSGAMVPAKASLIFARSSPFPMQN